MSALYGMFEHTADAVFGIDKNRDVRFWNKACEDLLGLSSQQAIGQPCAKLLCGEDLRGNKMCGTGCPIAQSADIQTPNSDFDLVLKSEKSKPVMVNIGSYYVSQSEQKNSQEVQVFHSMRPVNCHQLIQRLANDSCAADQGNEKIHKLSKREYEVLRLLAKGSISKNVADQLGISPATVRNHVKSIYAKIEVHNRAEAISYAMRHGIT